MALGIRGSNPIWAEFDLTGKIFDDTYYMFVLENTIPYIPAVVYHYPDLTGPWTNPIQFLGNGTLPTDIFFESDTIYRLEFRQNDGVNTPSQSDPLIYLVENYVPGSGGAGPVDDVAFASTNQITNPQFALTNFASPYSLSATNPDPIHLAPGWYLDLAGTGTVTLTKVALNNATTNPSNAPYALQITLTGWNDGGVFLRQRFEQNGMLWANKYVSAAITARIEGSPQGMTASLVDSNGATLGQVLDIDAINSSFNEFTGHDLFGATTNPNTPPAAYIDYKIALPNNVDIYLTSIQLIVQELATEPSFEQDSINRQIDHTYNTAYPIVPVGTIITYGGFSAPSHYLECNEQAISRSTYNQLFQVLTNLETVTLTSGVNTFTVASSANYYVGMHIESAGNIAGGTTITNVVGTTITMSNNALSSGAKSVRFFACGVGDGSTTFNVFNLIDYVVAGVGGTGIQPAGYNGPGAINGTATHTITVNEMPSHNHPGSTVQIFGIGGGAAFTANGSSQIAGTPTAVTVASQGGGVAMPIVQPTMFLRKCIRFE